jgi:CubicO group peptidase (beta-lactamase class C family)
MTGWPNWRPEGAPLVRERAPGEAFGYSGEGYNYLQAVVEHLVGQPLDVYMREAVLYPLGMAASSYNWATPGAAGVAAAHDRQGQPVHPYVGERPEAASSLHSTAGEYARFLCAMLDSSDSALPLHRDSLAEMVRPHVRITGALAWGLGWGLEDTGEGIVLWHWGDNPGFKHLAMIAPRTKTGVAIMTNGDAGLLPCEQLVARTIGGTHPALAWLARDFYGVSDFLSL